MHCVLVGNYGVGNIGDEALKEYFLSAFPHIRWTVLSAIPGDDELPRLPAGIRSFFTTPWWKTVRTMGQADAVVFGGGSLFTDTESSFACFLWFLHAMTAWIVRTPYFLAFQGVGPFRTVIGKLLSGILIRHAAFVSVRDSISAENVASFSKNKKCVLSFDPVILIIRNKKSDRSKNMITLIPRHNSGARFLEAAVKMISEQVDRPVTLLLMQPDAIGEQRIASALLEIVPQRGHIVPATTIDVLCKEIADSSIVLSERYHGAVAALALGIPVKIVSQAEGDKLSTLLPYANGSASIESAVTLAQKGEDALRSALVYSAPR